MRALLSITMTLFLFLWPLSSSAAVAQRDTGDLEAKAKGGDIVSEIAIGNIDYDRKDYDGALKWYRLAADAGDADAQVRVGLIYALGVGRPRDGDESLKWFRRAAEQGYERAYGMLGFAYTSGFGIPVDYVQAYKWWKLSLDRNYTDDKIPALFEELTAEMTKAQIASGNQLVAEWPSELAKIYRKAAQAGDVRAQQKLGFAYASGDGVPRDDVEASKWFARAAEQGDKYTPVMLASAYMQGDKGVPRDLPQAYKWLMISMKSGNSDDKVKKMFHALEFQMTSKEVEEGDWLVSQWYTEHPRVHE